MRHLANAQYWDRPAGGNTGRLFLAFGGPVCADRISNCPLDRVLTYKNLIYLLNLQVNMIFKPPILYQNQEPIPVRNSFYVFRWIALDLCKHLNRELKVHIFIEQDSLLTVPEIYISSRKQSTNLDESSIHASEMEFEDIPQSQIHDPILPLTPKTPRLIVHYALLM